VIHKITTVKLPPKGEYHNYIIAGDWHSHALHKASYEILKQYALRIPPHLRCLIINGDFLDCPHLMARDENFKKWAKRPEGIDEYFIPLSEEEFKWGNDVLDELSKIFPRIIFIEGNHEVRYNWFMHSKFCTEAYAHNFDIKKQLKLEERNIHFTPYNNWLDIGKVAITHGQYHGSTCLKKHFEAAGKSVIFSHIHHADSKSFAHRGERKKVWSLPAMCELNPEYMKNRDSNWSNGFGHLTVKPNGNFQFNVHEIWDDELIIDQRTLRP